MLYYSYREVYVLEHKSIYLGRVNMKGEVRVIQSIQRAIDIINCFSDENPKLSLADISSKLSLNISTARGIVNTLVVNNLLDHSAQDGKYSIGLVFADIGKLAIGRNIDFIKEMAYPMLEKMSRELKMTSRLQLMTNYSPFTALTIYPPDSYYILGTRVSEKYPLHATASGKLTLADAPEKMARKIIEGLELTEFTKKTITDRKSLMDELDKIRSCGYSVEDEETQLGISSIAAPVFSDANEFIGTISITSSTTLLNGAFNEACKMIVETAKIVSSKIRHIDG